MIETQEKTISNLLKAVKEQHDQLDYQKNKIKNLEEKVNILNSWPWATALIFCFQNIENNYIFVTDMQSNLHILTAKLWQLSRHSW